MNFYDLSPSAQTLSDLISGLFTSAIFLAVLTLLKPRIKMSDSIAVEDVLPTNLGQTKLYSIKIVNKSIFFKIYDIQIRAWTARVEPSTNADDISYEK